VNISRHRRQTHSRPWHLLIIPCRRNNSSCKLSHTGRHFRPAIAACCCRTWASPPAALLKRNKDFLPVRRQPAKSRSDARADRLFAGINALSQQYESQQVSDMTEERRARVSHHRDLIDPFVHFYKGDAVEQPFTKRSKSSSFCHLRLILILSSAPDIKTMGWFLSFYPVLCFKTEMGATVR
jgi:hypothetical protein